MMHFPYGLFGGEVVDPESLAREYQKASRLGAATTQYQWAQDAFPDRDVLKRGHHVKLHELEVTAELYREGVKLAVGGNNPDLTKATGDPDLYQVPYNRGLHEVQNSAGASLAIEWESSYPELIWIFVDYQYIRNRLNFWGQTDLHVRTQLQIWVDNSAIPGSGPMALPINGEFRGTGYARRAGRSRLMGMRHVSSGPHRVVFMAGQMPSDQSLSETDSNEVQYLETPPTEGVCIGSRKLILARFPRGGSFGV